MNSVKSVLVNYYTIVTSRPGHFRPAPVPGTQLPGPQRRTVPTVVGRKASAIAILRDGRFDGTRGAIIFTLVLLFKIWA